MNEHAKELSPRALGTLCGTRVWLVASLLGVFEFAAACGGGAASAPPANATPAPSQMEGPDSAAPSASAPPAVASAAATPATPAATSDAKPAATEPKTSAPSPSAAPAASPESSEPSVLATEVLTAPKVAFLVDYANSDAKLKAQAACEKDPKKDDPMAKSACLQKARNQFLADVLVFQKDKKDHVTLTIYKRNESDLKEIYVAPVSFANATAHSVQLKFKGGGSGQRPLFKTTNSPTLNLPNNYSVEIDDPDFGKLRYDAKIGFVDK